MPDFSKIILGTAQFGLAYGINNANGKIPENEIFKILDFAYQNKITILDTASSYGNSEKQIGKYLKKNPERSFKIIIKISNTKLSLEEQLIKSLGNLNTKKADAILFHSLELYQQFESELPSFIKLYKGKYFNQLGISVYGNDQINSVIKDRRIERVQLPFNMLDNSNIRKKIILRLKSEGKNIDARSVFLQGLFFKPLEKLPKNLMTLKKYLHFLHKLSEESSYKIEGLALNYVISKSYIDRLIIGIDSLKHLKTNIEKINEGISDEVISRIDSIQIKKTETLNPNSWTK
jgi:aryl-alcohol dehydrogenase-like predicted oxidoreductase